jgi:hypothetical protein
MKDENKVSLLLIVYLKVESLQSETFSERQSVENFT